MRVSKEEQLIQKVLFSDLKFQIKDFEKINFEKIIKIASSHLIIPAFYYRLKIKRQLKFFPKDFIKYIKYIYETNKSRNKILINEIKIISKILKDQKINHVFLKGPAMIIGGYYNCIGERMIGDIDFLFDISEISKLKKTLKKMGYYSKLDFDLSFERHLPRLINKKYLFAIEPHKRLFNRFKDEDTSIINKHEQDGVFIQDFEHLLKNNILNYQINDAGYKKFSYSYRNIYDTFLILKKNQQKKIVKIKSRVEKRYYFVLNNLGIEINNNKEISGNFIEKVILKIKSKYFAIYSLYLRLISMCNRIVSYQLKIRELLINKKYRNHFLKKL